jgi:hypothetical protein
MRTRLFALVQTILAVIVSFCRDTGAALARAHRHPLFTPIAALLVIGAAIWVNPAALLAGPILVGSLTETATAGEFIVTEQPGRLSRSNVTVTVPASTTMVPGYVVGKITASGKYVPYDDASSDGREVAAGILYGKLVNDEVTATDMDGVIIDFGAEVRQEDLTWLDEANDETTGLADLAARYIKARS